MSDKLELSRSIDRRYEIPGFARRLQTAYIAGSQVTYLAQLHTVMFFDTDMPGHDMTTWVKSLDVLGQTEATKQVGAESPPLGLRQLALMASASLTVLDRLSTAGIDTDKLTTPPIYSAVAPKIFTEQYFRPIDLIKHPITIS